MNLSIQAMHLPAILGLSALIGAAAGMLTDTPAPPSPSAAQDAGTTTELNETLTLADDTTVTISVEEEPKDTEKDALAAMREEISRLQTEYQLMNQRQKNAMLEMDLEKQAISAEASLRSVRQQEEMVEMKATIDRLQIESQLRRAQQDDSLARMKDEITRMQTESQLASARRTAKLNDLKAETERLQYENALLAQKMQRNQYESQQSQSEVSREMSALQSQLQLRATKDAHRTTVVDDMEYRLNPHQGDTVYITDRRIALNGPIFGGTADYVCDRINYFNNLSKELPIFIVIDDCPGGSVMEGYRIVTAIEQSPAPIHVVVKSFAASMAAVITTLAPHSYALPNAIILHHQMSSGMSGNLTQQQEQLENSMEWARRLAVPVADKMGVSYERFVEMMYENNSDGDWEEFADVAQELKWVENIVHEIRELSHRDTPTSERGVSFFFMAEMEQRDEKGNAYVPLPRLRPFDHYFLYNPDGYFRY